MDGIRLALAFDFRGERGDAGRSFVDPVEVSGFSFQVSLSPSFSLSLSLSLWRARAPAPALVTRNQKSPTMSGEDRAVSSVEASAMTTTTVSTTGGRAGKTAPRFVRVWDYVAARAAETHAVRCAIERGGRRLGVASLARHLRRRATSHAPRLERRRPNLKRRNERDGEKEGFKRCRGALRRRGRMHEVRFKAGESGESYRVMRTHAWHAKRCDDDDDDDECMFFSIA